MSVIQGQFQILILNAGAHPIFRSLWNIIPKIFRPFIFQLFLGPNMIMLPILMQISGPDFPYQLLFQNLDLLSLLQRGVLPENPNMNNQLFDFRFCQNFSQPLAFLVPKISLLNDLCTMVEISEHHLIILLFFMVSILRFQFDILVLGFWVLRFFGYIFWPNFFIWRCWFLILLRIWCHFKLLLKRPIFLTKFVLFEGVNFLDLPCFEKWGPLFLMTTWIMDLTFFRMASIFIP